MHREWEACDTNTHQDHVIAHVLGATILGFFITNETVYILLDIGFIWIVYIDGEMGLVPQSMAIAELESSDELKAALRRDLTRFLQSTTDESRLERFSAASHVCLITDVEVQFCNDERRISVRGEDSNFEMISNLSSGEITCEFVTDYI